MNTHWDCKTLCFLPINLVLHLRVTPNYFIIKFVDCDTLGSTILVQHQPSITTLWVLILHLQHCLLGQGYSHLPPGSGHCLRWCSVVMIFSFHNTFIGIAGTFIGAFLLFLLGCCCRQAYPCSVCCHNLLLRLIEGYHWYFHSTTVLDSHLDSVVISPSATRPRCPTQENPSANPVVDTQADTIDKGALNLM